MNITEALKLYNPLKLTRESYKDYAQVIKLPSEYDVYDFTKGYNEDRVLENPYGVGRFNEVRQNMYKGDLYSEEDLSNYRNIHMGVDIGCPEGEPVHSFTDGKVLFFADNKASYDYGPTIITEHEITGIKVYALYGHLSRTSLEKISVGQQILQGQILAHVGPKSENGGWNPHLHFQLSLAKPEKADMPGVVSANDRAVALKTYIDPRLVLGPLY